jgi:hypothetical protein
MASKIQLQISEPCHENWDKMTQADKGRFCDSCQKQVVDFTNMSDREIAMFFKKPSAGSVCGRFMTDQLQRDIQMPKKRLPWLKQLFTIILPAFLFSIRGTAQTIMGKINPAVRRDTLPPRPMLGGISICERPDAITPVKLYAKLTGRVTDETGQPIAWASIETGKIGTGTAANEEGYFTISQADIDVNGNIYVSSVGFVRQAVQVKSFYHSKETFTVKLIADDWMPEVVVKALSITRCNLSTVTMGAVSYGVEISEVSVKNDSIEKVKPVLPEPSLRFYPNPVAAGTSLTIETTNFESGKYRFAVYSMSGQLIRQSDIYFDEKITTVRLPIPATVSGSYFIQLINRSTGKKYAEKIIIL